MRTGIMLQGIGLYPVLQFAVTGVPMEDPTVWHACTVVAVAGVVIFVAGFVHHLATMTRSKR